MLALRVVITNRSSDFAVMTNISIGSNALMGGETGENWAVGGGDRCQESEKRAGFHAKTVFELSECAGSGSVWLGLGCWTPI